MFKGVKKLALCLTFGAVVATGCGDSKTTYTVTCPWAPSGVAALVSQKAASLSTVHSKDTVLVAEAIKGDTATVNTWVLDKKGGDPALTFVNESMLGITPIIDPKKVRFTEDDFAYVQNLYSSIFVLSVKSDLNIKSISDLKKYIEDGNSISIATNGATSAEAFLATALFSAMGLPKDKFKLTPYNSAAEAAQAAAKGETQFAISHQTQILEPYEQKQVNVIAAFDEEPLDKGPFKGVEGVGQYGYPYFKNDCFIVAKAGTSAEDVAKLRKLYDDILNDSAMKVWMEETMLIEINPMTQADLDAHVENVRNIVNQYKDQIL